MSLRLFAIFATLASQISIAPLLADDDLPAPLSPQESLAAIKVAPGFEVQLVAAEPLTMDPVAFAWGADAKLWVVEMADYPQGMDGKGRPGGRVRFLEDQDGDGNYDKSTLFLDGLPFPNGVTPWRKGVLVSCAPDILYAEDTDGDGRADRREVLFHGFAEGNQQHRANGFAWGLDGWLYGANGESGGGVRSLKTGVAVSIRGRDFRIQPDLGIIEAVAGQSQFGRARDDFGNWFGNNNSNPMYHYAVDERYAKRNPHFAPPESRVQVSVTPGASQVFPRSKTLARFNDFHAINRFTSACGTIVYRDDYFGPEFAGNAFISEPVHNLVHREVLSAKGGTFTSRRAETELNSEFLASSDNWFRPTKLQTGPDGALYVADMYRLVIEHPQWIPQDWQRRLDVRAGQDKGRIYRVVRADRGPRAIPRLDMLDTAGLVAALDDASGWQRDTAQRLLLERQDQAAVPLLVKLCQYATDPRCIVQVLWTLDSLHALTPDVLQPALKHPHAGVRANAVRLSEPQLVKEPALAEAVLDLVSDADAQVRVQLAYSLGEWQDPRASAALGRLMSAGAKDRFLVAAAMSSTNEYHVRGVIAAVLAGGEQPSADLLKQLISLAAAWQSDEALAAALDAIAAPRNGKYQPWQLTALAGLLDALDRQQTSLAKFKAAQTGPLAERLNKLSQMFAASRATVANSDAPESERVLATWLMGRDVEGRQQDVASLGQLLSPRTPGALQAAVVDALGHLNDPGVPPVLLAGWSGHSPQLRGRILEVLATREPWLAEVAKTMEAGRIRPGDLDALRRQQLLARAKGDERARWEKLLSTSGESSRQQVVAQHQAVLSMPCDAARGAAVFKKSCAVCHRIGTEGVPIGPDLTALSDRSPGSMLVAILDPNRAVEAKFLSYAVATKDGRTFNGLLAGESANSILLVGQDGKERAILRSEIEEMASLGKSLMIEGLEKDVTPQSLADLLAFLATQGPSRKEFPGNKLEVVGGYFSGGYRLQAAAAEIYGATLIFEQQYGNLGYWQSENDRAVWTVDITEPGQYEVTLDCACADEAAGNSWILEAGPERLVGKVAGTGGWDKFAHRPAGRIKLPAGRQTIVFRSQGPLSGALIDLRGLHLDKRQ